MHKKTSILLTLMCGMSLLASEILISHDILASRPTMNVPNGTTLTLLDEGGFRFAVGQETRDCWLHFPIDMEDLKLYDELEFIVRTDNEKAGGVFELHVNEPSENALAMKKNLRLQKGTHSYAWQYHHPSVSATPKELGVRMLNHFDNYHLPQSEINGPIDFLKIRFNVTREGIARLEKSLNELFDTARYAALGENALAGADAVRDQLKQRRAALFSIVMDSGVPEADRLKALDELYEMQKNAGWQIESAALNAADSKIIVGITGGADKIFRNKRFPGMFAAAAQVRLARQEIDSAQIALFPKNDLPNVTVQCSNLSDGKGNTLSQKQITISPIGYVKPQPAAYVSELTNEWIPDPILTETQSMSLEKNCYQPYWIDVRTEADQPAGLYKGTIDFLSDGEIVATVPLLVEVWNFVLPKKLTLPSIISADHLGGNSNFPRMFADDVEAIAQWSEYMRSENPESIQLSPEAKRLVDISMQTMELYRAHRIPYSDIYRGISNVHPAWKRKFILEDDGLFCLGYDKGKNKLEVLAPQIEAMRREGTAERAYIYGYDEITNLKAFQGMKRSYAELRKHFPDIKYTAVALDYTFGELTDTLDTLDAWIIPPTEYLESLPAIERARKRGKEVWWYPCNWPYPPDANLLQESHATATRLIIGFLPWKYNVDGFLYYASTFWICSRQTENWLGKFDTTGAARLKKYGVIDGYNQYAIKTSASSPKAGLKQTATLNQRQPIPLTFSMDIDVKKRMMTPEQKMEMEIKLNFQNKKSQSFRFPLEGMAGDAIHFTKQITPDAPVKSVFYALWIEDGDAELLCQNSELKQEGRTRKTRHCLSRPISGGPLFEDYFMDVFASNGDGSLFYPGINGTLPSLRTKFLRDGREDYEYLVMLKKAVEEVKDGSRKIANQEGWLQQAQNALQIEEKVCVTLDDYATEGKYLEAYRARIGALLNAQ